MAIAGYDRRDPHTVAESVPDYLGACEKSPKGLRIAWSPTLGYAQPTGEIVEIVGDAVKALQGAGCDIELVDQVMADPERIWSSEFFIGAGMRLKEQLETDPSILDPAVAELLASSLSCSLGDYYSEVLRRYQFRENIRQFFEQYDLLVTPTLPVSAFDVGSNLPPGCRDRNVVNWVYYTYPFNLTGQPAASVPAGLTRDGLPVGLQIVARMHREVDIFRAAAALEAIRPWRQNKPPS
jgi:aspartyl-tRNA(Asn)/glutamyl-tRNA(Gln) amidotransferase subunit A